MKEHGRKLTGEQVSQMRLERAKGKTLAALAKKYGIGITTVFNIVNGFLWREKAPFVCPHCNKAIL